jgi:hypothetical protein
MLTTGGSRLAGVDVADDDDVDMSLLLTVRAAESAAASRCQCLAVQRAACYLPHGDGGEISRVCKSVELKVKGCKFLRG